MTTIAGVQSCTLGVPPLRRIHPRSTHPNNAVGGVRPEITRVDVRLHSDLQIDYSIRV